jgi:hypothetical protein
MNIGSKLTNMDNKKELKPSIQRWCIAFVFVMSLASIFIILLKGIIKGRIKKYYARHKKDNEDVTNFTLSSIYFCNTYNFRVEDDTD